MEAAKVKAEEFEYANEILITKSELEEKNRLVFNLQQQVDETRTESEYQLRLKDNKFAEEFKMKDITDLKIEIRTRDDAIGEKEKRTTDLKRNAVELDKNRYTYLFTCNEIFKIEMRNLSAYLKSPYIF